VVPAINVEWPIVLQRIFSPEAEFWGALLATISIAIVAQLLGIALGLLSALAGLSRLRPVRLLSAAYVLLIRGTPLIVQIFFIFFGANLFFGFNLFPREVAIAGLTISGAVLAGITALAVNEGAYMSEIIRAGILAVDPGQMEAALSVGMTRPLAMRRIVLPQAARVIVPPLGNEFNGMIKNTSLLAFIGVYELFFDAEVHYSTTFQPVEYFLAVAFWYLVLTTIWSLIQARIERRLNPAEQLQDVGVLGRVRRLQWGRAH
jgi:polar amino acid transport system permease protein